MSVMLRMDIELLKKQMAAVAEAASVDLSEITLEDDVEETVEETVEDGQE